MKKSGEFDRESVFASLTEDEKQFLRVKFGIEVEEMKEHPICLNYLVTHRRILEIEAAALEKLRRPPGNGREQ